MNFKNPKIAFTTLGRVKYSTILEKRINCRDKIYYWIGGGLEGFEKNENSDVWAIHHKMISITPLSCNVADIPYLDELKNKFN